MTRWAKASCRAAFRASGAALIGLLGGFGCQGTRLGPIDGAATSASQALGPAPTEESGAPGGVVDAKSWSSFADVDYLAIGGRALLPALAPLLAHREKLGHRVATVASEDVIEKLGRGERDPAAFDRFVGALARQSHGKLRFVLLVGDAVGEARLPAHELPKLAYDDDDGDPTPALGRLLGGGAAPPSTTKPETFPSDHPLAVAALAKDVITTASADRRIAVGRVPARTREDVEAFVRKVVGYETSEAGGAWQRRLTVFAGPANYGPLVDGAIERTAERMLDDEVSYDFDVRFFFAAARSPYAYRFDRVRDKLRSELEGGALLAGYVGHGASTSFDDVEWRSQWFSLGTSDDAGALDVRAGHPFFISLACDTGALDRPDRRRSLATELVLNEHGAIAAFASSRESHPYANALYGQAILAVFVTGVGGRPRTIGEGILDVQDRVRAASLGLSSLLVHTDVEKLKQEHEGLYNLFGDPATRLRYPEALALKVAPTAAPGARVRVEIAAKGLAKGTARVTLETRRSIVRGPIVGEPALDDMPIASAFEAMEKNAARANDKVVVEKTVAIEAGVGAVELTLPSTPGAYVVKAITVGDRAAIGHADVTIGAATAH